MGLSVLESSPVGIVTTGFLFLSVPSELFLLCDCCLVVAMYECKGSANSLVNRFLSTRTSTKRAVAVENLESCRNLGVEEVKYVG